MISYYTKNFDPCNTTLVTSTMLHGSKFLVFLILMSECILAAAKFFFFNKKSLISVQASQFVFSMEAEGRKKNIEREESKTAVKEEE